MRRAEEYSVIIKLRTTKCGRLLFYITLHPAKGEDMAMSATTTILASLVEGVPRRRNRPSKGKARPRVEGDGVRCDTFSRVPLS